MYSEKAYRIWMG